MADAPQIPDGWLTYRYAVILDKFHLSPAQLSGMTDHQIDALCFYPRTSEGALRPPRLPTAAGGPPPLPTVTVADKLVLIDRLEHDRVITPQKAAEMREQVRRNGGEK